MAEEGNLLLSLFWIRQVIISGLGLFEIPAIYSDLIYVGVAECESGCILVVYNISFMLANKV